MMPRSLEEKLEEKLQAPLVTWLLGGLCGAMFAWQLAAGKSSALAYPLYADGLDLAQGKIWGLWTSFFMHVGFIHLIFNLGWLLRFGKAVEGLLGWKRYLLFWVGATGISSVAEYAVSSSAGVGASEFVYALFGLIWVGSRTDTLLRRQLDGQTVLLFVVWFFFCIFLTGSGAMQVGNAAHFGGFAFGALYAFAFLDRNAVFWKRLTVAVSILAFFPLIYAPWLSAWQLMRAQKAYEAGNYQAALDRYDRVHLDGFQLYVQEERAECFSRLGREADAVQVYKDLLASDTANAGDDLGALYNSYAWLLASSPDDKLRDPTQAIVYAQKACDSDGNSNSDSLDTLAVAYAAAGQFDQAVTWEQKAIAVEKNEKDLADLRAHLQLFEQKKPYRDTLGGGI